MRTIWTERGAVGTWLGLLLTALVAGAAGGAVPVEETFPVLKTSGGSYTNVTVTKKTRDWIFIVHSQGMINIKIAQLPLAVQQQLGYASGPASPRNRNTAASTKPAPAQRAQAQIKSLRQAWAEFRPTSASLSAVDHRTVLTVLAILMFLYLCFCYCGMLICAKAGVDPGLLIWLPVLQLLPLLDAAGMSRLWFFASFVPLLNLGAQILWSFNIVKARGKSAWVAFLLLLPITNAFAFLYLAFSETKPRETQRPPELMTLETA